MRQTFVGRTLSPLLFMLSLACALLFALSGSAAAQQPGKVHRIGLLISASDVIAPFTDAFRKGLRELGYVEGQNIVLEIRGGEAKPARLNGTATIDAEAC
jgi:putative tryptophan/tyrosine transport system substrate-binding protein